MNKTELKKAFNEGLITEEQYKDELFKFETIEKPPKKPKRIYEAVSEEDYIKLIKHTKKIEHKIAFMLGYGSGLRISEIVGGRRSDGTIMNKLQPEDIHIKEKKIFVRQAKGMQDRTAYTPKWLRQSDLKHFPLKINKRALQDAFLKISLKAKINWKIASYNRAGKEVPIYRYHFHCLRKSFVTRLLDEGVQPHHVKILVGHKSLATTTGYIDENPTKAIDEVFRRGL